MRGSWATPDAYPTIWLEAAALLQSIVSNHALIDGNKHLGWLATAVFLEINGASVARAAEQLQHLYASPL